MNIIELQERLKDLPEQSLMQEMQNPTGTAPQFLVLGELKRRKRMRDEYQRMQAQNMPTVAEETIAAAGVPQQGIMQMARAMAPKSAIAQDTGVNDMIQRDATRAPQPEAMADGGYVRRMAEGGDPTNYEKMNVITLSQLADQGDNAALNELRRRGFADPAPELGSMSPSELANMADQGDEQALGALIAGGMTDRQARGVGDVSADVADFMPTGEMSEFPVDTTETGSIMNLPIAQTLAEDTTRLGGIVSGGLKSAGEGLGFGPAMEKVADTRAEMAAQRQQRDAEEAIAASGVMPSEIGNLESGMDFDATAPLPEPKVTPAATPAATSSSGGAAGGYGDIDSRIAKMLADREKSAESDKWLALAQTGLALMASKQPSIGGAIGEAGLAGIGAMQQARSQYDKDVLELLTTQSAIQKAKAAAAKAGSSTAGVSRLVDDARQELNNLMAEARSYRKLETDQLTGEPKMIDMTPPGLKARIVAAEDRLATLNRLVLGGANQAQFDATAQ